MRRMTRTSGEWSCAIALSLITISRVAIAVPGPDTVAVIANRNVAESVMLAQRYADARNVPARQVCTVDVPDVDTITLADFRMRVFDPLQTCLRAAGVLDRVEAVVIARGLPLRVTIPEGTGIRTVGFAAALFAWRSTMAADMSLFIGQLPGADVMCGGGSRCYAARWRNPFLAGVFEPGWESSGQGVVWRPALVTMLHGRTYADAARLITSAIDGERMGGARGEFMFMNGADAARGVLDAQTPRVITALQASGIAMATRVPFDTNLTGHRLAAFFTGTASLGMAIEGNTFAPGAIVDNLTSFGAVPDNFLATGESQVSIARWVSMGVAGAHGTVAEPLNNCFPNRDLIVDYVNGSTLSESYFRNMPFAYWLNLVLGDPMAAPYATRPTVTLEGVRAGDALAGARRIVARATDPMGRAIAWVAMFADGVEVGRATGDHVEVCANVMPGMNRQILAVAQVADDGSRTGAHQPKGWTSISVTATTGDTMCAAVSDGGAADASSDGNDGAGSGDGAMAQGDASSDVGAEGRSGGASCACRIAGAPSAHRRGGFGVLVGMVLCFARARRPARHR